MLSTKDSMGIVHSNFKLLFSTKDNTGIGLMHLEAVIKLIINNPNFTYFIICDLLQQIPEQVAWDYFEI